jgi:RNA polymerase sigma-70 factor (ECF subfamily)
MPQWVRLPMRRTAPSTNELRIAAGLRRRDPEAVRALYAEYGPSALALVHDAIRDRGAAEDVFQQVLLEAWLRCRSYDPTRASLRTWLATIARSRTIDHLRRRVPEPWDPATAAASASGTDEQGSEILDRLMLDDLLRRLPAPEAEVVRLRFHVGLSQSQIATLTGLPLGTVKSRMTSALRHLRTMLEDEALSVAQQPPPQADAA